MKKTLILMVALAALATATHAQNEKRSLGDERRRTAQGIRSGKITKAEAALIRKQARDVRRAKQVAKADGRVTPREKAIIARQDGQLDRTIRRTKHNRRQR